MQQICFADRQPGNSQYNPGREPLKTLRNLHHESLNKDIFIAVDLNFNFNAQDLIKISKRFEKYRIEWQIL